MSKNFLYLASQSKTRQQLLEIADIPFKLISHKSDERVSDSGLSFEQYVLAIAQEKMQEIIYPPKSEIEFNKPYFFLTSDTLVRGLSSSEVFGKPKDLQDAKRMLRALRDQTILVATACCLEKKIFDGKEWKNIDQKHWVVTATAEYCVDEESLDKYLEKVPSALSIASGATIEGYGHNFVKTIDGSYSAALGLPIFELRQILKKMNF